MKLWVKITFLTGLLAVVAWFILSGKSRFITGLVARRWLTRLEEDKKAAQVELRRLEQEEGAESAKIKQKRDELSKLERKITAQEDVVRDVPPHLRDHAFNAWWDSR